MIFLIFNRVYFLPNIPFVFINRILLVITFITLIVGLFSADNILKVTKYSIDKSERYHKNKQIRIIQFSDLHLSPELREDYLIKVIDKINKNNADIVFITGDLFDRTKKLYDKLPVLLKQIKTKYGIYAITGNHEYFGVYSNFKQVMKDSNIKVLENTNIILSNNIQIVGINDPAVKRFDKSGYNISNAFVNLKNNIPTFYLSHQPKDLNLAIKNKVDIVFSGHTHGGQFFPFTLIVKLAFKYIYGLYHISKNTDLIVSSGAGYWGPAIRFLSSNEIVVVDFKY